MSEQQISDADLLAAWDDGHDTKSIADRLQMNEADAYNRISKLRESRRKLGGIDRCIDVVSNRYLIRRSDLIYGGLQRGLVKARHLAMALSRGVTGASFPAIGRSFGGADHTTVIYATRRAEALYPDELATLKSIILSTKEAAE